MHSRIKGFTIIELVAVIVILGTLSIFILPKLTDTDAMGRHGFKDGTIAAIRYAQKTSIAQLRTVCVNVSSTGINLTEASVVDSLACDTPVVPPSPLKAGSLLSGSSFKFLPSGATDKTGTISLLIGTEYTIKIDAVTGYVR